MLNHLLGKTRGQYAPSYPSMDAHNQRFFWEYSIYLLKSTLSSAVPTSIQRWERRSALAAIIPHKFIWPISRRQRRQPSTLPDTAAILCPMTPQWPPRLPCEYLRPIRTLSTPICHCILHGSSINGRNPIFILFSSEESERCIPVLPVS